MPMFNVKVRLGDRTNAITVTTVQANGAAQARALAQAQYGPKARVMHVTMVREKR